MKICNNVDYTQFKKYSDYRVNNSDSCASKDDTEDKIKILEQIYCAKCIEVQKHN